MSDQLLALRLFVLIARANSFSRAARELKVSQPTASRMITDLEQRLGVTLVTRSTRAVALTDHGRRYLLDVEPILAALDSADDGIGHARELSGELRVGLSSANARRQIMPCLGKFLETHPSLRISLVVEDKRQDLILDAVDVALRFGRLPDTAMRARRIGTWPLVVAASPAYLASHPPILDPSDLANHEFIVAGPIAGQTIAMTKDGRAQAVEVKGRLTISSSDIAVSAVCAGYGLAACSTSAIDAELASGSLVRVLTDWHIGDLEAHALFPGAQPPQRATRAFVDFLVASLQAT